MTALRVLGALLLVAAGTGGGFWAAQQKQRACDQVRTFARLLEYLGKLLEYQALPGAVLLVRAARYTGYAPRGAAGYGTLAELPVPPGLPQALQRELRDELSAIEELPRATACASLRRMASLCQGQARELQDQAREARRLWPRLGASAAALAVIVLW